MRGWWRDFADLVLPPDCGGCGRSRTALCDSCRAALYGRVPQRVRPASEPAGLPTVYAAAPYADEVRAVLLAHKERGALGLAEALGAALAGAVRAGLRRENRTEGGTADRTEGGTENGTEGGTENRTESGDPWPGPLVLVPVPSARRAVRARGHDPARRIAVAAARELRRSGLPARVVPVLRQRREVADQSGLNSRQRLANLAGALEVVAGAERLLAGRRTVLVDDLMTTGASLAEAARALRVAGVAAEVDEWTTPESATAPVPALDGTGSGTGSAAGPWHGMSGTNVRLNAAVVASSPDSFEINRN
ncbi:ComF family protein [Streptomyces sp. NPDC002851]